MHASGDDEKPEVKAVILFQKTIRGIAARSAHQIHKLIGEERTEYIPFLLGNDDPLTAKQYEPYRINTNFVLVGTALFRSVDIACHMAGESEGKTVFSKVIIVDNSTKVVEAWGKIKKAFADSPKGEDWRSFLMRDDGFLELLLEMNGAGLCRYDSGVGPYRYFMEYFNRRFELDYVKNIVAGVVVIQQSWGDLDTFKKLARIYADRPIVAYPSNIVESVEPDVQIQILRCVENLKPVVSLCTNLDSIERRPTKCYVFTDSRACTLADVMELGTDVRVLTRAPVEIVHDEVPMVSMEVSMGAAKIKTDGLTDSPSKRRVSDDPEGFDNTTENNFTP